MGLDKKEMIQRDAQRLYEEVLREELLAKLHESNLYGDLSVLFPTYQRPKSRFAPKNARALIPFIMYLALSLIVGVIVVLGYNAINGHGWFAFGLAAFAIILFFLSRRNWYMSSEQDLPKSVTVMAYITSAIVISATLTFAGLVLIALSANALSHMATSL